MKQTMMELMTQMMPYMMPAVYAGAALLAIGVIALLVWFFSGWCTRLLRLAGRLLIVFGLFFLACEFAGLFLGAEPKINFGDATKFEFNTKPFWMFGLAFLIPGIVMRVLGAFRPTH
ncbi:MAG: transporter [Rhodomicrobium sp.]